MAQSILKRLSFLKTMISDVNVAAIASSSPFVVKQVLSKIGTNLDQIIEHGPGDGVMTKALLSRLSPDGKLTLVETNIEFIEQLKKFNDPRIIIFHGKVHDFYKELPDTYPKANLIISSIPFSFSSESERDYIVKKSFELLSSGGRFIIFHQYSKLMFKTIQKYFRHPTVFFQFLNFPPCFGIIGEK